MRLKGVDADPAPLARQWNSLELIWHGLQRQGGLLVNGNWSELGEGSETRFTAHSATQEQEKHVLCRSAARAEKEKAMNARQGKKIALEFAKIYA